MINIRDYALRLIEFRDRTQKELYGKLLEKGYSKDDIDDEIEFLKNYGYIDDDRFLQHYVHDAINLKNLGKFRIRTELIRKGIDRDKVDIAIEDAFSEIEDDRVLSQMQTRFKNSDFSNIKERTRIFNFFMRRGFSAEEIKGAMNKMCSFNDIICDD